MLFLFCSSVNLFAHTVSVLLSLHCSDNVFDKPNVTIVFDAMYVVLLLCDQDMGTV